METRTVSFFLQYGFWAKWILIGYLLQSSWHGFLGDTDKWEVVNESCPWSKLNEPSIFMPVNCDTVSNTCAKNAINSYSKALVLIVRKLLLNFKKKTMWDIIYFQFIICMWKKTFHVDNKCSIYASLFILNQALIADIEMVSKFLKGTLFSHTSNYKKVLVN